MTEKELRQAIVLTAASCLGAKEGDERHKAIVEVYNSYVPLARNYKLKYTDPWCASFVSFCFIEAGLADLIVTEVGCEEMIRANKAHFIEDDNYTPKPGDLIFYDWDDKKPEADNTGWSDHVGIVEKVIGQSMTIIEGNSSDAVRRLTRTIGQQYIRGYICPDYASIAEPEYESWVAEASDFVAVRVGPGIEYVRYNDWNTLGPGNKVRVIGEDSTGKWHKCRIAELHEAWVSASYLRPVEDKKEPEYTQWVGAATTLLNVRTGPGSEFPKLKEWPRLGKGNKVRVIGQNEDGSWLKVNIAEKYEAWVSAKYIKAV